MDNDQLEHEAGEFFDESLPEGEPENYEHDQEGGTPEGIPVGEPSIMERMDEIVAQVVELKKLMNYKEDVQD